MLRKLFAPFQYAPHARGKPGARAYAIGDVHGCIEQLDDLLQRIKVEDALLPPRETFVIFLGDLVDRGPDSAGVVERAMTLRWGDARVVSLKGNHEEFLLRALQAESGVVYDWLRFGGRECVASYGLSADHLASMSEAEAAEALRGAIPKRHRAFLENGPDTFRFGDFLFVHAGIRPGLPLEAQCPSDLRWIREPFLDDRRGHGHVIVHGHTIESPHVSRANRIGIDTGAYRTGILTAVMIEDEHRRFFQTDPASALAHA